MPGLIADTHVHIYSLYDQAKLLKSSKNNLVRLRENKTDQLAIFLTERADCDYFSNLPDLKSHEFTIQSFEGVHAVDFVDHERLWVFQGYQINTAEKIEVLSLAAGARTADGLALAQTVLEISNRGGNAVACWAFGKWCGTRGSILQDYLSRANAPKLLLADSALRCYPSRLLARANNSVLAGTDPLPLRNEEARAGCLAVRFDSGFELNSPLQSVRALLSKSSPRVVGQRLNLLAALTRALRMNLGAGKNYRDTRA